MDDFSSLSLPPLNSADFGADADALTPAVLRRLQSTALIRIVDDDEAMRTSYRFMLGLAGWQIALYADAAAFLEEDDPEVPGCLILDVRMPGKSGLELQREIAESGIDLPIIFVTGHGDVDMAVFAVKAGAFDFMLKPVDPKRLKRAVALAVYAVEKKREEAAASHDALAKWHSLSERERQVVLGVAHGMLNKVIASALHIAERTVKFHRASACRKLGVKSASEITAFVLSLPEADRQLDQLNS